MTEERKVRRRTVLGVLGTGAVAGTAVGCGGEMSPPPPPPPPAMPFDAGPVTDFPAMTWRLLPAPNNVIVGRDAMGLFAFTAVCTHEACIIRFNPTGPTSTTGTTRCPCHMSTFNGNGEVQPGSRATRNLPHFQVTVASGRVTVNPTMTVDAAIRTAV